MMRISVSFDNQKQDISLKTTIYVVLWEQNFAGTRLTYLLLSQKDFSALKLAFVLLRIKVKL